MTDQYYVVCSDCPNPQRCVDLGECPAPLPDDGRKMVRLLPPPTANEIIGTES